MTLAIRPQCIRVSALVLSFLVFVPIAAAAQATGSIRGRVLNEAQRPISGATVSIVGSTRGGLTNPDGEFVIANVPVGPQTVRAQMIGFARKEMAVTVAANQAATADFVLATQALALDEVVVTGTAGAARKREVGNSIGQIKMSDVVEPVANVDQLLQSRTPGMVVTEGSGMAGSGAQIRLRGTVSISQSNQPLIYVDGVRVKSDAYQKNVPPGDFSGRSGNITASPLSDIDPADIDRIEIIKGAAATTLYGTEASAGVIQIFTKRGTAGAPRWNVGLEQGFNRLMAFAPDPRPFLNIDDYTRGRGSFLDRALPGTGIARRQGYSANVSGGTEQMQYFVSGSFDGNEGVLPLDEENKLSTRGNFTFAPLPKILLSWNTSYARNAIQNTPAGNNAHGLTLNAFRQERNYFSSGDPEIVRQVLDYEINTWIDRFITGGTATYAPTDRFTNRFTIGYDLASQENRNVRPYGFVAAPNGILSDQRFSNTTLTFDYVGSYRLDLGSSASTTISFGGQSVTNSQVNTIAKGDNLPGPGDATVSNTAIQTGVEERQRTINAGVFGQALFAFRDRYFLTVGGRVDGNSAFGSGFGLQMYPKISGSYVISDEEFWPEKLGTMKLRAAYGQSGRAPGAFDAVRTWDAVQYAGESAFIPSNLGNPDLGPERTAERELGFDAAFLNQRVTTEFTYYHSVTSDALFLVRHAPSEGFSSSQLLNVGKLQNQGVELAINANVYDSGTWGLDLGGSLYTNRSEVLDLGGATEFSIGGGWIKVGEPVFALRANRIVNADAIADPIIERDHIFGPQNPTHTIGMNMTVRMPRGLELQARGEYQGGGWINDGASENALQRGIIWPTCTNAYALIEANQQDQMTAWERKLCISANYENNLINYPKDFFKIREVSLRVPIGTFVPGTSSANLTLSARNFYTWKNSRFLMFDPEMVGNDGFGSANTGITEHIPPTASFVASLRMAF
jgi:outer membrane receptor protein involved in Fe transport